MGAGREGVDRRKDPAPIEKKRVLCNRSGRENGLYSFRARMRRRGVRKRRAACRNGTCAACGTAAVDRKGLDRRGPGDAGHLVESLKKEHVGNRFWTGPVERADAKRAAERGADKTSRFASRRAEGLAKPSSETFRDGMRTPPSGDIVYYAQHATATCCRKCRGVARNRQGVRPDGGCPTSRARPASSCRNTAGAQWRQTEQDGCF